MDTTTLTKKELIQYIIKVDEMVGSKPLSQSTLEAKNRATLEAMFQHTLSSAVSTMNCHRCLIQDDAVRNQIDAIVENHRKDLDEFGAPYEAKHARLEGYARDFIKRMVTGAGLVDERLSLDNIYVSLNLRGETLTIGIKDDNGRDVHNFWYYRDKPFYGDGPIVSKINFGTVGSFDITSDLGKCELTLMQLIVMITGQGTKDWLDDIMDDQRRTYNEYSAEYDNKVDAMRAAVNDTIHDYIINTIKK